MTHLILLEMEAGSIIRLQCPCVNHTICDYYETQLGNQIVTQVSRQDAYEIAESVGILVSRCMFFSRSPIHCMDRSRECKLYIRKPMLPAIEVKTSQWPKQWLPIEHEQLDSSKHSDDIVATIQERTSPLSTRKPVLELNRKTCLFHSVKHDDVIAIVDSRSDEYAAGIQHFALSGLSGFSSLCSNELVMVIKTFYSYLNFLETECKKLSVVISLICKFLKCAVGVCNGLDLSSINKESLKWILSACHEKKPDETENKSEHKRKRRTFKKKRIEDGRYQMSKLYINDYRKLTAKVIPDQVHTDFQQLISEHVTRYFQNAIAADNSVTVVESGKDAVKLPEGGEEYSETVKDVGIGRSKSVQNRLKELLQLSSPAPQEYCVYPAKSKRGKGSAGQRRPQNPSSESGYASLHHPLDARSMQQSSSLAECGDGKEISQELKPVCQPSDATSNSNGMALPPKELVLTSTVSVFRPRHDTADSNAAQPPTTNLMSSLTTERSLRLRIAGQDSHSGSRRRQPPRHPQYADHAERERSFTNWRGQDPRRMIIYGLFFTGREDLVRCFQCGIGLKDWAGVDEPLLEHIKHSGSCEFLLHILGESVLDSYKERIKAYERQNQNRGTADRPPPQFGRQTTANGTAVGNQIHPRLSTLESRIETFINWPSEGTQSPSQLADAGLFYTGTGDLCRCFTCDGGLQRWNAEDDPWLEHTRWFPHCQFVIQTKGQTYIQMVLAAVAQANLESAEPSVTNDVQNLTLDDVDPLKSEAGLRLIEMGYSKAAVVMAVHEFNGKHLDTRDLKYTADDLIEILVAREDRGEPLPENLPSPIHIGTAAGGDLSSTDPEIENQRLKRILKCAICKVNDCNILFLPCTHRRLCEFCAESVDVCPTCKRKIDQKLKTFMA